MTDYLKHWQKNSLIVSLDSRKGGVGKTSMGLAMARAWLNNGLWPVVALDADLLGSEMTDLVNPWDLAERFPLGLLDLLTQSTGANDAFYTWISRYLAEFAPKKGDDPVNWDPGLPGLNLTDGNHRMVILPTLVERSASERQQAREGLGLRFLSDDFGRTQIELRLTMLLTAIIEKWKPKLIIIDGSPFHMGLGRALGQVFAGTPASHLPQTVPDTLKETRWMHLEVLGTEPSEVATLGHIQPSEQTKNPHRAKGWVLNRDHHRIHPGEDHFLDCIPFEYLEKYFPDLDLEKFLGRLFLHVGYSPRLGLQSGLPFLETFLRDDQSVGRNLGQIQYTPTGEADWDQMWRDLRQELDRLPKKLWNPDKKAYESVSWLDYLGEALP